MFIVTLIAKERLARGDISAAEDALAAAGLHSMERCWVEEDAACDLVLSSAPALVRETLEGLIDGVDAIVQVEAQRRRRLLVADMDSTMITVECIDELADFAGLKAEVAAITERAMRGEIGFEGALKARLALLKGLDEKVIDACHEARVRITPGARELVRTMREKGGHCVLVSGGFTHFAERVGADIGFDLIIANQLQVGAGKLLGTVEMPIVGAEAKRIALQEAVERYGLAVEETLAVGDGANDIPMIQAAGLGVAFHAKPVTAAAAAARIDHCDLSALLYAQGYGRSEWAVIP